MTEIWLRHPEFPDYEVSTLGRIRSWHGNGNGTRAHRPRIMAPYKGRNGYLSVTLVRDGSKHRKLVHRLVLETHVGYAPEGMTCRHLNGVRDDDRLTNLAWGTSEEQLEDRRRHGTWIAGADCHLSKLTEADVMAMRALRAEGTALRVIAERFNTTVPNAWHAVTGSSWSHLPNAQPMGKRFRRPSEDGDAA